MQRLFAVGKTMSLLLCAGLASQAQDQPCLHRTVISNVVNEVGKSAVGCDEKCFQASLGGKPAHIEAVNHVSRPARIVVLLDASGSMRDKSKWDMALFVATTLFTEAPDDNPMALIVFGTDVFDRVGLSVDKHAALQELEKFKLKSLPEKERRTAIYDALLEGLAMLGPSEPGDVLCFITDGTDNVSKNSIKKVKEVLLPGETRMFGTLLMLPFNYSFASYLEHRDASEFEETISDSGGSYWIFYGAKNLRTTPAYELTEQYRKSVSTLLGNLFQQANNFYRLDLLLPKSVDKQKNWELSLVPLPGLDKKTWRVIYPRKLLPCEQSSLSK
jgi:hypothetical protein